MGGEQRRGLFQPPDRVEDGVGEPFGHSGQKRPGEKESAEGPPGHKFHPGGDDAESVALPGHVGEGAHRHDGGEKAAGAVDKP